MHVFNHYCALCSFAEICKEKNKNDYEAGETGCEPHSLKRYCMVVMFGTDEQKEVMRNSDENKKTGFFDIAERILKKEGEDK